VQQVDQVELDQTHLHYPLVHLQAELAVVEVVEHQQEQVLLVVQVEEEE